MQVDWAGSTVSYTEPTTGEDRQAYIFVAVLPASSYPFAYAYRDMTLPNWISYPYLEMVVEELGYWLNWPC